MELERSWRALELAEKHLQLLEEAQGDQQEFREAFVCAITVARRVSHVIIKETESFKRPRFVEWCDYWDALGEDDLINCVIEARNAVLKEGGGEERTARADLEVDAPGVTGAVTAFGPRVETGTTLTTEIAENEQVVERFTITVPSEPVAPSSRLTWVLVAKGCRERELLPALRDYLRRMRDEIIPEAQRLISSAEPSA